MRVCTAEQGMVEQDVFLDWKPFKEYEDLRSTCNEWSTITIPGADGNTNIFFPKYLFP